MSDLNEKKHRLHKTGLNFFEKKMLKNALRQMAGFALQMNCDIFAVILNLRVEGIGSNETIKVIVTNHENGNWGDLSYKLEKIREEMDLFDEMCDKLITINKDCAEFWNTPNENITFQAWQTRRGKLHTQVRPIEGFPEDQVMILGKSNSDLPG